MWQEEVVACCKLLLRYLSAGTEKYRKNIRIVLSQAQFEPGSALIYIRSFTSCARLLGGSVDYVVHFICETCEGTSYLEYAT
jgi:hypothetical protein